MHMHGYGTLDYQDGYQQSAVSIYRERNCEISRASVPDSEDRQAFGVQQDFCCGRRHGTPDGCLWVRAGAVRRGGGCFAAWFRDDDGGRGSRWGPGEVDPRELTQMTLAGGRKWTMKRLMGSPRTDTPLTPPLRRSGQLVSFEVKY